MSPFLYGIVPLLSTKSETPLFVAVRDTKLMDGFIRDILFLSNLFPYSTVAMSISVNSLQILSSNIYFLPIRYTEPFMRFDTFHDKYSATTFLKSSSVGFVLII